MATTVESRRPQSATQATRRAREMFWAASCATAGAIRRWWSGLVLFSLLAPFSVIGRVLRESCRMHGPSRCAPLQPPSAELPFGSDKQGRDLFAVMVTGTPLTLRIGLIAGFIGVGLGALIGFVSAYYGGWLDTLLRGIVDVGLTIPGLMVLIVIAMMVPSGLSVNQMALVVALARLALSGADDPRPGADAARAELCPGGSACRACRGARSFSKRSCRTCCPIWRRRS